MKKFLFMFFAIIVSACKAQNPDTASKAADTDIIQLKIGETTILGNTSIRFDSLTDDSRCPEGMQCIWAGEAKVQVLIEKNGSENLLELVFGTDGITKDHPQLLLNTTTTKVYAIDLAPYPKGETKISSSEYYLVLKKSE